MKADNSQKKIYRLTRNMKIYAASAIPIKCKSKQQWHQICTSDLWKLKRNSVGKAFWRAIWHYLLNFTCPFLISTFFSIASHLEKHCTSTERDMHKKIKKVLRVSTNRVTVAWNSDVFVLYPAMQQFKKIKYFCMFRSGNIKTSMAYVKTEIQRKCVI